MIPSISLFFFFHLQAKLNIMGFFFPFFLSFYLNSSWLMYMFLFPLKSL